MGRVKQHGAWTFSPWTRSAHFQYFHCSQLSPSLPQFGLSRSTDVYSRSTGLSASYCLMLTTTRSSSRDQGGLKLELHFQSCSPRGPSQFAASSQQNQLTVNLRLPWLVQWWRICLALQGHAGLETQSGKISRDAGQLSLCTPTMEARLSRAHTPQQEKSPQGEVCALQLESSPHSP